MIGYEVEFKGLEEQLQKLRRHDEIADRHLMKAMKSSVVTIAANVKAETPVNIGTLRNSIGDEVKHLAPLNIEGRVGTSLKNEVYPMAMEFGARPHFPNLQSLAFWVARKLGVTGWEGILVTISIARKIAARGLKKREYMKTGWEKSLPPVNEFFVGALEGIAKELEVR